MGTPSQKVNLWLDTGSKWLLVDSEECTSGPCLHENLYNTEDSTTGIDLNDSFY